jgi:carbonic anhydrase
MRATLLLFTCFTALLWATDQPGIDPEAALRKLESGNQRYLSSHPARPHQDAARRAEVAGGQHPHAAVLSCADSRVPPELIFDEGLGDLFVVRVAGNVVTPEVLGSIEYAVEHLGCSLVLVLGHKRCGAVQAALSGGREPGAISSLIKAIQPAIGSVKGKPGDTLDLAVRANVQRAVGQLKSAKPVLSEHIRKGALRVAGAVYDLDTGAVTLLP